MAGKVIQASFLTGPANPAALAQRMHPIQAKTSPPPPGPPTPAFPPTPSRPLGPATIGHSAFVQRQRADGAFVVDPGQLGLAPGRGKPLPEPIRLKMETALGADFSDVRIHVGPQAARIGARAFTVGSDIYFAPNQYQAQTVRGQQLLGHELAHVIQQRTGRTRNPLGSGFAVVCDARLEAEADRLGQKAAAHRTVVQAKPATIRRATIQHATIQRAASTAAVTTSFREDAYFFLHLTAEEKRLLKNPATIRGADFPIKWDFDPYALSAVIHVDHADPGENVASKFKKALVKIKYYMEYAAIMHRKDVRDGYIELRPTGGVVVKQMVELLAFVGKGALDRLALKKKVDELKKARNVRRENALAELAQLERARTAHLRRTGGDIVLELLNHSPKVEENPSPGMAELITQARSHDSKIKELKDFIGDRGSYVMAEIFFDEHLYMLQTLIDRGRPRYFTVTAYGLPNDLEAGDPLQLRILRNDNALLEDSVLGDRARQLYARRLRNQDASLLIRIYFGAIDDVISAIP